MRETDRQTDRDTEREISNILKWFNVVDTEDYASLSVSA